MRPRWGEKKEKSWASLSVRKQEGFYVLKKQTNDYEHVSWETGIDRFK